MKPKRYYTKRELTALCNAKTLLVLNGLITDNESKKIHEKLMKLTA